MDAMLSYEWPGNVRELENMIQQMVAVRTGPLLHLNDLPSPVQNHLYARRGPGIAMAAAAGGGSSYSSSAGTGAAPAVDPRFLETPILPLMEMERRAIVSALEYTKGDRLMAAGLLGIGRTTLYRKLKEYQMAG